MEERLAVPTAMPADFMPTPPEGLSTEDAQKRADAGLNNHAKTDPGKTVGQIIADNLFTLFNLLNVLEGKVINDAGENTDTVSGEVTIALPQSRENLMFNCQDTVVVCGNQPEVIRRALEMNVNCLILCQVELSEGILREEASAFRSAEMRFEDMERSVHLRVGRGGVTCGSEE